MVPPIAELHQKNGGHGSSSSQESIEQEQDLLDEGIEGSYLTDSSDSSANHRRHHGGPFAALQEGPRTKIFNDMVHTHLEVPELCYRIINTPQFQRLRNLKQLGVCYHVYPSACHNRFEHCIGTSYLAGKYCKILQQHQPELNIDSKDILCLYIGGLCHDLGHGPFSHTWENFMNLHAAKYSHEDMSILMLDYLLEHNNLWTLCQEQGLFETDLIFIKELILGHPLDNGKDGDGQPKFLGRPPNKHFLYQIVSNEASKIDVDKFDYILRDSKQLHLNTAFDYERVLDNSRVFFLGNVMNNGEIGVANPIQEDTRTTLAYRKKISENLEDLFQGRFSLHQKAYQHKVVMIVEVMIVDGLEAAEPYFQVPSGKFPNKVFKLSTACQDITAFEKLTDSVLEQIVYWDNGGQRAKRIFGNILKRKLYRSLGYLNDPINADLLHDLKALEPSLVLMRTKINYGKGSENPLNCALFYEKSRPTILFKQNFSDPKLENKCFIVLRPSYAFDESRASISDKEEEEQMQETEEKVTSLLIKHNVRLELE